MRSLSIAAALMVACTLAGCPSTGPVEPDKTYPGRQQTLDAWDGKAPEVLVNLPASYGLRKEAGPDFDVYTIAPSDPGASTSHAGAVIYLGHHPQPDSAQGETVADTIGARQVRWQAWSGEGLHHRELHLRDFFSTAADADVKSLVLHIMIAGSDEGAVKALAEAMRSLRLAG